MPKSSFTIYKDILVDVPDQVCAIIDAIDPSGDAVEQLKRNDPFGAVDALAAALSVLKMYLIPDSLLIDDKDIPLSYKDRQNLLEETDHLWWAITWSTPNSQKTIACALQYIDICEDAQLLPSIEDDILVYIPFYKIQTN